MPAATAAQPKTVKATKIPKVKKTAAVAAPTHAPYIEMIKNAITAIKDRKGASKSAILKHVLQNNKVGENIIQVNSHLKLALVRGVTSKALVQTIGKGANGRFRVAEKSPASAATKKPTAAKKPTATKKPTVVKAKAAVKSKAAGKPKSSAKPKSPASKPKVTKPKVVKPKETKAKKPATEKKTKSPKKAAAPKVKKVAKSPAKKASAKKVLAVKHT